jgi:hypothetical protein
MADLTFDQLQVGKPVKIEKNGKTICVARVGDEVFAVDDTCSHSEASLSEGDVTDIVKQLLEIEDNFQFNIHINNENMGGDPAFGLRKFLIVEFSPKSDLNKIYKMGLHEGQSLTFKF